ncbi:MAG: PAS domain S-box protein [Sterolibacteriaceae bacterium MAG5]|nr:PAS domain S-box protein [Candidatus Nitricoxidireducens bremensis]
MISVSTFLRDAAFRKQLNVTVTIGVMFFALASSLLTSWQGSRQVRQTLQEQGRQIAETLARQSTLALVFASPDNASEAIRTAMSFPDVTRVEIRHLSGRSLVVRGRPEGAATDGPLPDADAREAYLEAETEEFWRFVAPVLSRADDSPYEIVERKEEVLGFVRVEQSKATLTRVLAYIFLANLAISVVFAVLFLYVLGRLAARLTRPITDLSVVMARAEKGETSVRASLTGPKDIRDMAKAFNNMIAALEERELALRESRASYREIFDSVNEVIFQTNARGEWELLNPAWRQVTGIAIEDAVGKPMASLFHDEERATVEQMYSLMQRGVERDCRFEVRFTRRDGSVGWLNVAQHVRNDESGAFAGTSGILDDITERKLAAERMASLNLELENRVRLRTAELEASNRELEAFSYSVSHDLRAPLRAIDGFSRLIEEDYADKLDDTGRGYFARVRSATQRMSQLIDDLLNLARITRATMNRQPTDLSALAADVLKELTEGEPGRRVEAEIAAGLVANVDPVLVRVVLDNLIGNAWKYSAKRDVARIAVGMETRQTAQGSERVFFVRDNGAGFDMAYADKLFRPFSRLHGTNEFAGTGIGLATVQRVIYRHGGRIWADAVVDGGASFYFTLPGL